MSLPLSEIGTEEMRLRNCIANLAESISVPLAGDEKTIAFGANGGALENPAVTVRFSVDGKPIAVQFAGSILTESQLSEQGVVDFSALPDSLRQLLTERVISADLDRFESWSEFSLESANDVSEDIAIPFRISDTRGAILADSGAEEILLGIFERLPRCEPDLGSQMIDLPIELGRTLLNAEELRSLESRDVILIDDGPDFQKGAVEIRPTPNTLFKASLTETEISINEIIAMDPEEEDAAPESEKLDLDNVPIELVFEIGRQQISLEDLGKIQPGSTLPLERPPGKSLVSVRANGKTIGTGELVQVGDRVGVRLN